MTHSRIIAGASSLALAVALVAALTSAARADADDVFQPGNLIVSRSVFPANFNAVTAGVTQLPPHCVAPNCVTAVAGSAYPYVFNNAPIDGSFGLTSQIFLDEFSHQGQRLRTLEVPNSAESGISPGADQMVGSFSSKSELALNLSADGRYITFNGYLTSVGALDVSNSNTPGVVDPTNAVPGAVYRLVATMDAHGHFHFTKTNAYSGNNGRASIWENANGYDELLMAGNAGNGSSPQPDGVLLGAGAQIETPTSRPLAEQPDPGLPTPVGSFNVTELGDKAEKKAGKDNNFRGLTVFNNVVYFTKGSGGKGVNSVYFIDTSGLDTNGKPKACPNGVGVPSPSAGLPYRPMNFQFAALPTLGLYPYNMCVLAGFPTAPGKTTTAFPFGVYFANATTMYVADEGDGSNAYANGVYRDAAASKTAGLQKWMFDAAKRQWKLAYTLQAGLGLGKPYKVAKYPTGENTASNLPWAPATDGLRNLTGRVNQNGMATIFATTSTVSGSGDQGADPNRLVVIKDQVAAMSPPRGEHFVILRTARSGEALRGVSYTPGTGARGVDHDWAMGSAGWQD